MWRITLEGLLSHRVRLALTTLSVVLGAAFVSGTYVLTATVGQVFDDLIRGGSQSIDVLVRSASAEDAQAGTNTSYYGARRNPSSAVLEVESRLPVDWGQLEVPRSASTRFALSPNTLRTTSARAARSGTAGARMLDTATSAPHVEEDPATGRPSGRSS